MKILLVDDEQAILDIFTPVLQKEGFEVTTAMNAKDALQKAQVDKPNLILLDQILPDMNGNQILPILKKDSLTKDIPVAILSNYGQQEFVKEAIDLGAADYIFKYQISPQDIIAKVNQVIKDNPTAPAQPTTQPTQPV